jgi:SIR2-like domain
MPFRLRRRRFPLWEEPPVNQHIEDRDWERLLARIQGGHCTPFLGAGACFGTLPLGSEVARRWVADEDYPLEDEGDLARVAQFLSVNGDPMWPKEKICAELRGLGPPDFDRPGEPHAVLAELPIPVYMTTNYDDFMMQALQRAGKSPHRELCRWNDLLKDTPSVFDAHDGFVPTVEDPIVYHLHGTLDLPESIVLTEDDYLDFLVSVSRREDVLAPRIQQALSSTSLLFLGYKLADSNFRVLHRGLVANSQPGLRRLSVAVQLSPVDSDTAREYLARYFEAMSVIVYWGDADEFARTLLERWTEYPKHDRTA